MKRIIVFIYAFFASPARDLKKEKKQFELLKTEMLEIRNTLNSGPIHSAVKLFQVISLIQDAGGFSKLITKLQKKNYGQLDKVINALQVLQKHIQNAGRSEYGINRTKTGETVDFSNVWFGNIDGIWTKSALYWLENRNERIDLQAKEFASSHVSDILNQISLAGLA